MIHKSQCGYGTSLTPFHRTNGSKLTTNLGNAVLHACKDLKQQLTGVLRERIGTGPVVVKDGNIYGEYTGEHVMSLEEAAAKACYANNGSPFLGIGVFEPKAELGDMTGYGNLAPAYPFGIQMAEVTVHDDGGFTVDKIVSVHDIGRVINTQMASWSGIWRCNARDGRRGHRGPCHQQGGCLSG